MSGGHFVGLATTTPTHTLHLDKIGVGATPARGRSQCMRNELREQAAARPGFKEPRLLLQYPVDYLDVPHDLLHAVGVPFALPLVWLWRLLQS